MLAQRMKKLMDDIGMNQNELSLATGISKSGISQYLSGKFKPGRKALKSIAKALGTSEAYLTGDLEEPVDQVSEQKNTLTVEQTARLMNKSKQFVRVGLQKGVFPFGYAVKLSGKFTYYISKQKFTEYTGIKI